MKTMSPPAIAGNLADALDALAPILTTLASVLRTQPGGPTESKHVDQYSSPLSRRVYLDHARQGHFPTVRVGKRVIASRAAFESWLASLERPRSKTPTYTPRTIAEDALAAALEDLGARPAKGGRL